MKLTIRFLLILQLLTAPILLNAQVSDDFTDGDFSNNPTWVGDNTDFEIDTELRLHLNAPPVDNLSHLAISSSPINDASWEITLNMDFNPSSTSGTYIYLASDQSNLESALNGYFVLVGSSSDEISLYRQDGTSITKIIDGTDDIVDQSSVTVRVKVTRDEMGLWELLHDVDLSGSYTSEGTTTDDIHGESNYFGIVCEYIASRSDAFWFDDVLITGNSSIDNVAPDLNSVSVIDEITLELLFSEELDVSSAENIDNYTWLPLNTPASASANGETVLLTFADPFPENIPQEIQVESVEDLTGNQLIQTIIPFTNVVLGTGLPGSVVINEFMPDPTPTQGLPEEEYLELYNASDSAYNLLDWNLRNSDNDMLLGEFILLPGQYLIICDDSVEPEFASYGDVLALSSLTALSNSGDDLYLFNAEGELLEELVYDLSWYGAADPNGFSLERRNPNLPCNDSNNWGASTAFLGGTPGIQNSNYVADDTTAPEVAELEVLDTSTLLLTFNEGMDELALILGSYTLDVSNTIVPETTSDIYHILLNVDPALTEGQEYSLTVSDVIDCSGNELVSTTIDFFIPDTPENGDVIINEIMADPSPIVGLPETEYLEILNVSDKIFNLNSWVLRNTSTDMVFPNQAMLPGDYLILCEEEDMAALESFGTVVSFPSFSALSNGGDDLYIFDNAGTLIEQVIYTSDWYNDGNRDDGGYSLERINPNLPCSNLMNWKASEATVGGTPGSANAVLDLSPDISAPNVLSAILEQPDQITITFNEPIESSSVDDVDFTFTPLVEIQLVNQVSLDQLVLVLEEPLADGVIYNLSISGIEDCSGNNLEGDAEFLLAIPQSAEDGDIIINEVLFNPYTGGTDFVELYNRSARPISLRNWKMANRESGDVANIKNITSQELLILPGEFKVLTEESVNIGLNYPLGRASNYIEISDLPSYNDDEGNVLLLSPALEIHDEFFYSDDYHFALIDDLNGVSLERIDYERLTNDPTNWHSAAEKVGWATPGYENSQLQPANAATESFIVEPEVFSPDNDGFQDVLNISYALDGPGQVANISIFDRDGRQIRLLSRNELLATEGTVSWDGITDDGTKARIGVYIIFIELFDLKGDVSSTKKTCVLGGRF